MQNAEVKIKIFGKILYTSDKDEEGQRTSPYIWNVKAFSIFST